MSNPFYLRNIRLADGLQEAVEKAAKETKRDIRLLEHPIPSISKPLDPLYNDGFGCIAVYDGKKDCSKFVRRFQEIYDSGQLAVDRG